MIICSELLENFQVEEFRKRNEIYFKLEAKFPTK